MKSMVLLFSLFLNFVTFAQTLPIDKSSDRAFQNAVKVFLADPREDIKKDADPLTQACINACPKFVGNIPVTISVILNNAKNFTCNCEADPNYVESNSFFPNVSCPLPGSPLNTEGENLVCSAESAVDEMKPESGACSLDAEDKANGEAASAQVDPAVGTLVDFDTSKMTDLMLQKNGLREEMKDKASVFNQFLNHVESSLSDGAKEKFLELKKIVLDKKHEYNETALKNLDEMQNDFKRTMDDAKLRPRDQKVEIASTYLENFFSDDFKANIPRDCDTKSDGTVIDASSPQNMPKDILIPSIEHKSLSALGPDYANKKINYLSYSEYIKAAEDFDTYTEKKEEEFLDKGYIPLFAKDYRDFLSPPNNLCNEPKKHSPGNFGKNFKNNHYKTHGQDYLASELSTIKSSLDKDGKVSNLTLNSSCSVVPNTPEKYNEGSIKDDLTSFEINVFPFIEDNEDWKNWLEQFREEIKGKKDPFTISFEDLARLRSLKVAGDLIKGEPRLKDKRNKISVDWTGSNGNGTSGTDPYDAKTDPKIYESHKYVNLQFDTVASQDEIDKARRGKAYFANDAYYLRCKDKPPVDEKGNPGGPPPEGNKRKQHGPKVKHVPNTGEGFVSECLRKVKKKFDKGYKKKQKKNARRYNRPPGKQ